MRILICDDDASCHAIADAVFAQTGAVMEHAYDAVTAEVAVRKGGYSLVLMDLDMPGFSGLKAVRWIRSMAGPASRVPIIALTNHSAAEYEQRCREAGMNGFLQKPLTRASLAEVLSLIHQMGPIEQDPVAYEPPSAQAGGLSQWENPGPSHYDREERKGFIGRLASSINIFRKNGR